MARRISVKKLAYATRQPNAETGKATYGTPVTIKKFISISMEDEKSEYTFYSDGVVEESSTRLSKVTGEIELGYLDLPLRKVLFGNNYDEAKGILVKGASDVPANVALLCSFEKSDGTEDFVVLYNCTLALNSMEGSTREDDVESANFTLSYTAIPDEDGRIQGEASSDGGKMTSQSWFGSVQTVSE